MSEQPDKSKMNLSEASGATPKSERVGESNDVALPRRTPTDFRQRYKLTIAYDGSHFHGWQKQHPPDSEPLRTVQGIVEDAIQRLIGQRINLIGASRTDAGVHALGQVAQFDAAIPMPPDRLMLALNHRLPPDVEVRALAIADDTFNAIADVDRKQYRYRIHNVERRPLDRRHVVHHYWVDLDIARMNDAARRLIGTHDFEGFATASHGRHSTIRTIFDCRVERHGDEVHILVEGDGFLYNMVRILAGTLVEIGRGRFEPDRIDAIIQSGDRGMAGPTLPPEGLWLEWIRYK